MAVSTLDANTALIVIDLQKGIVAQPTASELPSMQDVISQCSTLADAFRQQQLPIVWVNVNDAAPGRTEQPPRSEPPAGWDVLVPELPSHPEDHRVTKGTWGAFSHTDLNDYLQNEGVTQVVIAGVMTSLGVESTARQAQELGFNVALAVDAMTDRDSSVHYNSVRHIFPRLGQTDDSAAIIARLGQRAS